ncbi:MAG: tyrosine-type recombinase/integrase [Proteobacteria bacterium]|nr:tyrosine-type recombinase/integrase [Pseudomonadota bacterium]
MAGKLNLLTDTQCKNATSESSSIRKLHDGGGLYLWVYADGSKYWRLRYWLAGKEKSLSLGVYPRISLKDARKARDEGHKQLDAKKDPSAERKAVRIRERMTAENSFEAVAREWYKKQVHTWVPTHAADVLRRLEINSFPFIGRRPIADIEAPELLLMARKMEDRGAFDLAHRVLQVNGQVFRYGIATGRCSRDITADLRGALTPHKAKHQPSVRPEELPDLVRAIAKYEDIGDRKTRLALQLLSLAFVRTNELLGAEWNEFDFEEGLWVIPAGRMKMKTEHIVPLSKQAVAVLEEMKPIAGDSRFVFPGRNNATPMSNNTMLFALYRLGYKGKMTGHGFRSVASTILHESGWNSDAVERQLAHCERNEVKGAYNRAEYLPERRKMMDWWGDYIEAVASGAKVVPFKRVA